MRLEHTQGNVPFVASHAKILARSWLVCLLLPVFAPAARSSAGESGSAAVEDLWSLAPVKKPELPAVEHADWCATPVDRFIRAGLEAEKWSPPRPWHASD